MPFIGYNINGRIYEERRKFMVIKRGIGLSIVLTIITCGLYGIYWFIKITDEANYLSRENETSGGIAFLLTIVTCGIYKLFWNYKMGKTMLKAQENAGMYSSDNSVLYLILSLFGLDIISYCIIQSEINKIVDYGV